MNRFCHEPCELHVLVARLCDEDLDEAGRTRLNELLAGDEAAQAWYVEYVDLHVAMRRKMQALDDEDFTLLEVQAALNAQAPTIDGARTGERIGATSDSDDRAARDMFSSKTRWLSSFVAPKAALWAGAAAAALVLSVSSLVHDAPNGTGPMAREASAPANSEAVLLSPAKLSGAVGARWAGPNLELPEGERFAQDQRLELIEGLAELTFRSGARVIVQGPAVLQLQGEADARISLGRIAVSTAPKTRRFTIHTAAVQLSCHEAEFGADVGFDGSLVTEVYRGNVEFKFGDSAGEPPTFQLARGQGADINAKSRRVTPLAKPYDLHFVRYLPKHELLVNLADVVAGGNGLRKAYHRGISLVDGRQVDDYGAPAPGDGRYVRAAASDFVDGVFIPNGKLGPVQVDSIGRTYDGFGATSGDCWGGVIMPRRPREERSLPFIRLEFHGDNYGYVNWLHIASKAEELSPEGYGLVGMHSNCGITFDLHAIRARHPAKQIMRFRAQVGNLESKPERYVADAWVLVDGELRYHREKFSREDGRETINIPLTDRDRFLVLAVTDVGGDTAYDWVAFGDPIIELAGGNASLADAGDGRTAAPTAASIEEAISLSDTFAQHSAPRNVAAVVEEQTAFGSVAQLSTLLFNWQIVNSILNHVERTPWHEMIAHAPAKL